MDKEQLIDEFRAFLDAAGPEVPPADADAEVEVDLQRLFVELAALRSDVKRESRQVKEALDAFRAAFAALEESRDQLAAETQRRLEALDSHHRGGLRQLLLDVVEVRDRLQVGLDTLLRHSPRSLRQRLLGDGDAAWRQGAIEGQRITLRRLDALLAHREVRPTAAEGQPLDPHTMRAVEVSQLADQPDGAVVEVLRPGYRWGDETLRLADVRVNRRAPTSADNPEGSP
ncbi:MAG: nucleotide exchange factor GrpE [Candidatus Competibacterales bacterium]